MLNMYLNSHYDLDVASMYLSFSLPVFFIKVDMCVTYFKNQT